MAIVGLVIFIFISVLWVNIGFRAMHAAERNPEKLPVAWMVRR